MKSKMFACLRKLLFLEERQEPVSITSVSLVLGTMLFMLPYQSVHGQVLLLECGTYQLKLDRSAATLTFVSGTINPGTTVPVDVSERFYLFAHPAGKEFRIDRFTGNYQETNGYDRNGRRIWWSPRPCRQIEAKQIF